MTQAEILLKLDLLTAAAVKLTVDLNALREIVLHPEIPPAEPPVEPPLPPLEVSPDGASIPPLEQIVDRIRQVWTVRDGKVYLGANPAGFTNNTDRVLKYDGEIVHRNSVGNWYAWTGMTWRSIPREPGTVEPPVEPPPPPKPPTGAALSVRGKDIVDADGNVWIGRGVSVIGLRNVAAERGIKSSIDLLADWGCNLVRLPVYPSQYMGDPGGWNRLIDLGIMSCMDRGMHAIIDWHDFEDNHSEQKTRECKIFWADMANRHKDNPYVLFELFNEPVPPEHGGVAATSLRWRNWAQARCDEIRQIAPDNIIMVGGPHYSQWMGWPVEFPIEGRNIAYVFHLYPGGYYVGGNDGPGGWELHCGRAAAKVPFFVTEWGFGNAALAETQGEDATFGIPATRWMGEKGISSTAWVLHNRWFPVMFKNDSWTELSAFGRRAKLWIADRPR